jgi:aminomethyltransferase
VSIEDVTDGVAALALQGPLSRDVLASAAQADLSDLRYFSRRELSIAGVTVDVSRTGYTGDLGYELWIPADRALPVWDAIVETGTAYALRPVGILALDVARVEAGLIMAGVDYTSVRHALTPEQSYSPFELGLGDLVKLDKEVPFVGLDLDWADLERLYRTHGLSPALSAHAWRDEIPIYEFGEQVGRATSGTWSPVLQQNLAIGTVVAGAAEVGTELELEWSVEGQRGRIGAEVVALPFFDPPRKRA